MLSMTREPKPGHWQTVGGAKDKKKRQEEKKEVKKDRLGVAIDPASAAFAAFDKAFLDKGMAAKEQQEQQSYKGAFAGLVDEAPAHASHDDDEGSSGDEASTATPAGGAGAAALAKPKQPKAPKKPKLTVAQVAAGVGAGCDDACVLLFTRRLWSAAQSRECVAFKPLLGNS